MQRIAQRRVGNRHTAEDLVQDSWVAALEADVAGVVASEDLEVWRAWIGGVTRNLATRRFLRDHDQFRVERNAAKSERAECPQDIEDRMELQQRLARAIAGLVEPYRTAVVMRYLDGVGYKRIAQAQRTTSSNARQRVSRALTILRKELGVENFAPRGIWAGLVGMLVGSDDTASLLSRRHRTGLWPK
jgi:RNA polymerase sigma-70 factor (ECF subfamily)